MLVVVALLLVGYGLGRAADHDETAVTVKVSSADHEAEEGYFSLGDSATLLVKPGSEIYQFLSRQRGHKIKVVMTEAGTELSRLDR
jgi:hypothetical protein